MSSEILNQLQIKQERFARARQLLKNCRQCVFCSYRSCFYTPVIVTNLVSLLVPECTVAGFSFRFRSVVFSSSTPVSDTKLQCSMVQLNSASVKILVRSFLLCNLEISWIFIVDKMNVKYRQQNFILYSIATATQTRTRKIGIKNFATQKQPRWV